MGYVHDTHMTQFIPPTMMYGDTATWAMGAGEVAGTIVYACDATDEVANLYVPILLPSNSEAGKGAYLKTIEIDYELKTDAADSVTASLAKITRGANGSDAVVAAVTVTQDLAAAVAAATADEHKLTVTLSTPIWIDNDEHLLLKLAVDKKATTIFQCLGVFANWTLRV